MYEHSNLSSHSYNSTEYLDSEDFCTFVAQECYNILVKVQFQMQEANLLKSEVDEENTDQDAE